MSDYFLLRMRGKPFSRIAVVVSNEKISTKMEQANSQMSGLKGYVMKSEASSSTFAYCLILN